MTDTALDPAKPAASVIPRLLAARQAWLTMDRNPDAIRFAGSALGICVVHLAFFAALLLVGLDLGFGTVGIAIVGLTGCALLPAKRSLVIAVSTLLFLVFRPFQSAELAVIPAEVIARFGVTDIGPRSLALAATALFMLVAWLALATQRRFGDNVAAKRPVLTMMLIFWGLVAIAQTNVFSPYTQAFFWTFLASFSAGIWFLAYALTDQKAKDPTPSGLRLGLFRPFWSAGPLPTGKGAAYLRKFEAKDDVGLAASRLKGLKLLVWAVILTGLRIAVTKLAYGPAGLPTLGQSLDAYAAGAPIPVYESWLALVAHYLLDIALLASWSHVVVAIIRMAGYAIPRNTVRPLSARTLAEFWNRYYFYFKELLVDFFFFPAFLRYFKRQPKLRVAFATLCAACFGNFLFHFTWNLDLTLNYGLFGALQHFESYAVYSLLLAAGLIVSQLRKRKPKPEDGFLRYDVIPRLGVGLFFCLIAVFDETPQLFTMHDRIAFFFSLFGVL